MSLLGEVVVVNCSQSTGRSPCDFMPRGFCRPRRAAPETSETEFREIPQYPYRPQGGSRTCRSGETWSLWRRFRRRGRFRHEVGPNAQIASKKADLDHQKHPCTHPHEIIPCFHLPNHLQNQPKKRGGSSSLLPPPLHDEIILHFGHPNHVLFCDNQVSVFNEYHDLNMTKS